MSDKKSPIGQERCLRPITLFSSVTMDVRQGMWGFRTAGLTFLVFFLFLPEEWGCSLHVALDYTHLVRKKELKFGVRPTYGSET